MDSEWWTIEEAPSYEMNDKGIVRNKDSKRCIKVRDDGAVDDPYVLLRVDGRNIRRSVYVLRRSMQMARW